MIHHTGSDTQLEVASFEQLVLMQRTKAGMEYDKFHESFARMLKHPTEAQRAQVDRLNAAYVQMRDVNGAVHVDTLLSNFSVLFKNDAYIGTELLPEVQVEKQSNRYAVWDIRDQLAYPDDSVAKNGDVKQLSSNVDLSNSYIADPFALEELVDVDTIDNADAPLAPLTYATMKVLDGIAWNQERRCISVLTTTGNYGSNFLSIPVGSEWNSAGGGNPVFNIQTAEASILSGPTPTKKIGFCSYDVYLCLARHPQIRDLHKYTQAGLMPPAYIAQLFNLDALLVGRAWKDTANPGQTLAKARMWPNVFGIVNVMSQPAKDSYSFGATFRWGAPFTEVAWERRKGRRGSYVTKCSKAYQSKVTAPYAGYLLTNCLA
jgi:hypothetical protein